MIIFIANIVKVILTFLVITGILIIVEMIKRIGGSK